MSYLIRLDDACPTMHHERWARIEKLLDKFGIRPLVGIIPCNKDKEQECSPADSDFWNIARNWQHKGWAIALHGYDHCYHTTKVKGMNPLWRRSEFVGLSLDLQRRKIRNGLRVLTEKGLKIDYFFAPSHTFDENTLEALRLESDIRIISDTIADKPYRHHDFIFIPQIGGKPCRMLYEPKIRTFCLHPSTMTDALFVELENFLTSYNDNFIGFDELNLDMVREGKSLLSRFLSTLYFSYRNLKGIK